MTEREIPVAVFAGTPVDTKMGAAILTKAGIPSLSFPVSPDPITQTAFQISSPAEKNARMEQLLLLARSRGCRRAFVYCNSLSGAVDFQPLAETLHMRIITPLQVYRQLASRYRCLGVIAANAQGLAGIERVLAAANPSLRLLGTGALPVVLSVEAGLPPEELVELHQLPRLADWFAACGAEALLLGCTHFPYFKASLSARTSLPVLDPSEDMLRLLSEPYIS